mgnify:CR=1 FL=1
MYKRQIVIDGKEIELTEKQIFQMKCKQIPTALVQHRIYEGWTLDEAIKYNPSYITKGGEIWWVMSMPKATLYIPAKDKKRVRISRKKIEEALVEGDYLDDVLGDKITYFVEYNERTEYDLAVEDTNRQQKAEQLEKERHKRLKPHLYNGTPQAVKPTANMLNLEYTALSMFMTEDEKREMRVKIFEAREEESQCR